MVNLTGMIETDLLILEIVCKNVQKNVNKIDVEKYFKKYDVPEEFFKLRKFFDKPHFSKNKFKIQI